jgi:hypothetical protein
MHKRLYASVAANTRHVGLVLSAQLIVRADHHTT